MPKVVADAEVQKRVAAFVDRNGYSRASKLLGVPKSTLHRAARSGKVTLRSAEALMAKLPSVSEPKTEQTEKITERDIESFSKVLHALIMAAARLEPGGEPKFAGNVERA